MARRVTVAVFDVAYTLDSEKWHLTTHVIVATMDAGEVPRGAGDCLEYLVNKGARCNAQPHEARAVTGFVHLT